jgi:hypothetical protein
MDVPSAWITGMMWVSQPNVGFASRLPSALDRVSVENGSSARKCPLATSVLVTIVQAIRSIFWTVEGCRTTIGIHHRSWGGQGYEVARNVSGVGIVVDAGPESQRIRLEVFPGRRIIGPVEVVKKPAIRRLAAGFSISPVPLGV